MRDFIKFVTCILAIAPCMLVLNGNDDCLWVNFIGFAYTFCLIGYLVGNQKTCSEMLSKIEQYEREILNED